MRPHRTMPACTQRPRKSSSGLGRRQGDSRIGLLIVAAVVIGSGGWFACGWNIDYLDSANGAIDGAVVIPPDVLMEAESDAGPPPVDAGADGTADGAAPPQAEAGLDANAEHQGVPPPDDAACDPTAPTGGTNYISNPGFEDPMDAGGGWFANFGGTFVVSSTHAHCGTNSGEVTVRTAYYNGLGTNLPSTAGTYAISMWVMQDGTSSYQVAPAGVAYCGDAGAASFVNIAFATLQPNVWTYVNGTLTVPSNCTTLVLAIGGALAEQGAVTPNIYVDDAYAVR